MFFKRCHGGWFEALELNGLPPALLALIDQVIGQFSTGGLTETSLDRQTNALNPVIAFPTIRVFISRVPSYE
jgi:hypothetical protein